MRDRCPQDGGFIGDAGCTHPNHQHSELVKRMLSGEVRTITEQDADAALSEGFYVDGANGMRIGFGQTLKRHLDEDHVNPKDIKARKETLLQAIEAVKFPDKVEWHHEGLQGRTAYTKSFDERGILAVSDRGGKNIEFVFNIIPKRSLNEEASMTGKKKVCGVPAKRPERRTERNYTTTGSCRARG